MISADRLRERLDSDDYKIILQRCNFRLNGGDGPELSSVLGPDALGEGENANFSVNLADGLVKDWGSSGYQGNVFQVVQDVHGLDFNEALEWIVNELNLDRSRLTSETPTSSSTSNGRTGSPSSPNSDDSPDPEPEPVASHEQVEKWSERLLGDSSQAQAARGYLTSARGISLDVLKASRIGLAYAPSDNRATWWIMIPIPDRRREGAPIVATKGFGFDPSGGDWERNENGSKVARNGGSATLYDLVPSDPNPNPVLVCEGELDALSCLSNQFNAVTGTAGAGTFRPEWAERISSLAPAQEYGVVVAFDGDEKGRNEGPDVAATLAQEGLDVRLANLPDGQDVNDVLMNRGREGLEVVIDTSISLTVANGASQFPEFPIPSSQSSRSGSDSDEKSESRNRDKDSEPTRLEWEDFPLSALPSLVEEYVRAQASAMCIAPSMIAIPSLSALAAAVGNARHVELKSSWTEPPTIWTMLIAPSGALKSPALEKALVPIFRKERQLKEKYERRLEEWQEEDEDERGEKPERQRLLLNDATVESCGILHSDNPRGLLLYRDELAGWLGSFNQYNKGESDLQKWIEFYESRLIEIDRKSTDDSIFIQHPSLSVTGAVQPQVLDDQITPLHFQSGFVARAILCEPPEQSRRWTEASVTEEVREQYYDLISKLYQIPKPDRSEMGTNVDLSLSGTAKEIYKEFYNECQKIIESLRSGPLRAMTTKNQAMGARLALSLQLSENPHSEEVRRDAMIAGTRLARWLRRENARVYQQHGFQNKEVSRDRQILRDLAGEILTISGIKKAWECSESTAYRKKDELIEKGVLEKAGTGKYQILVEGGNSPFSLFD